jgi:hypothetical protein
MTTLRSTVSISRPIVDFRLDSQVPSTLLYTRCPYPYIFKGPMPRLLLLLRLMRVFLWPGYIIDSLDINLT